MKGLPELFLNLLERRRVGTKSDLKNTFVRAACPEKDGVDWIRGRLDSDIPQGDVHTMGSRLLTNCTQHLAAETLGRLELRTRRRTEAQLKGFHTTRREDLAA